MSLLRAYRIVVIAILLTALGISAVTARRHPKRKPAPKKHTSAVHKERLSREAELAQIRREIVETERQIAEHSHKERLTKKQLAARDAEVKKLQARLAGLRARAEELRSEEAELDTSIKQTSNTIDTLKTRYATEALHRYITGAYREKPSTGSGLDDPIEEAAHRRSAYFASLSAKAVSKNKSTLDSSKTSLTENREEVASMLGAQLGAINETTAQQHEREAERQQTQKELQTIQARKAALQKELDKRKQSAKRLEAIIASLAAKEEAEIRQRKEALKKREAERKKKRKAGKKLTQQEQKQERLDSEEQKNLAGPHSLGWPTSSHRIVQGFGEQRNKELGTVTVNLGIDIGSSKGAVVHAAEKGKVALVSSLPSYGTLVIIRHGGGILTVYANLESTAVSTGSVVTKGETIGRSGSNSELGEILHFEVWNGRTKQNPLRWLNK